MARSVPAVVRALDVLELFLDGRTNLSAPEVANALGLPRTTVHELLATLVEREYVERLPDNAHRFRLGLRVFELGNTYAEALDVVRDGQSVVDEVAARCGETCQLAVLDGRDVVYVAKADGSHDLRVQAPVGRRSTALRTAAGRVLLAHLPWSEMDRRFPVRPATTVRRPLGPDAARAAAPRLRPVTAVRGRPGEPARPAEAVPADAVDAGVAEAVAAENARLRRELAGISQRGVGSDPGGSDAVVRSVAAAIRDHLGHVVAAVEISVPVARWDPQRFATLEGLVRRAAARASSRLGFRPPRVTEAPPAVAAAGRSRRPVTTSRLDPRALAGDDATRTRAPRPGLMAPGGGRVDDGRRNGGPFGAGFRPAPPRFADPRFADPRLADPRFAGQSTETRTSAPRLGGPRPAGPVTGDPATGDPLTGAAGDSGPGHARPAQPGCPSGEGAALDARADQSAGTWAPEAGGDPADEAGHPDHVRLGRGRPGAAGPRGPGLGAPRLRQLPTLPNPS